MERAAIFPATTDARLAPASAHAPIRARPLIPCALDRHVGPYDHLDELDGFLGSGWCRCGSCGSVITLRTSQRNAA